MYKVFVNEKELFFSKSALQSEKTFSYTGREVFEISLDLLQNTSCKSVNIYSDDIDFLWQNFRKALFTIEAAGGLVHNGRDEVLFIKRLGKWDLPKGKIEAGESTEAAALREVEEETGIKGLSLEKFLTQTYHIYTDRNTQNILKVTHWFSMSGNENNDLKPQLEEGITEVCWKNKSQITTQVFPATFKNIQLLLTEFN